MGQAKSKEIEALTHNTHFSKKEIIHLRRKLAVVAKGVDKNNITEDVFIKTVRACVPCVSPNDDIFLRRLYAALDVDDKKHIVFSDFVRGLSKLLKGTPEEKLDLSFRLYDVNRNGYLTRPELEKAILELSQSFPDEDRTNAVKQTVARLFEDVDVDGDGRLQLGEYRLSAMKEPLMVDFLEQFLSEHHLLQPPSDISRPQSMHSFASLGRMPASPTPSRLSVRVSQAELLEYSHHSHHHPHGCCCLNSVPTSPSLSTYSPRSTGSPPPPSQLSTTSGSPLPQSPRIAPRLMSRTASDDSLCPEKTGIPAAITTIANDDDEHQLIAAPPHAA